MSRPDKLPSWVDDDAAAKSVEPSGTKKLQGWIYKERPAFQFWNWIFRNFVKWVLHLDVSVNHFDAHEAATPDMTVILSAGKVQNGITLTSVAEQITAAFVAPVGNPRIDRIVIDSVTGVYSVIPGAELASPVAPALTSGKIAICQVLLDNSPATTAITNDLITDERPFNYNSLIASKTVVASTSGTDIDFTDIPSWVKEISILFDGVSNSVAADIAIRIGDSGGFETSGYDSTVAKLLSTGVGISSLSTYFTVLNQQDAASESSGIINLKNIDGNTWICTGILSTSLGTAAAWSSSGTKTLSGALTQLRIHATQNFDSGAINVLYK